MRFGKDVKCFFRFLSNFCHDPLGEALGRENCEREEHGREVGWGEDGERTRECKKFFQMAMGMDNDE